MIKQSVKSTAPQRGMHPARAVQGGHIGGQIDRLKFGPVSALTLHRSRRSVKLGCQRIRHSDSISIDNSTINVGRRYTIQPGLRNFTSSCVRTSLEPADARSRGALLRQLLGEGLLGAGGGARFPLRVVLLLLGLGLPGVRLGSARAGTGYERVSDVRDRARNASTMIRFW